MRERLVIAFVGLTLAIIGLYGVPRAYFLADLVRDEETTSLQHTATLVAALVDERTAAGGAVDLDLLEEGLVAADAVEFVPAGGDGVGTIIAVDGPTDGAGGIEATRSVPGGTLRLTVSGDTVSAGIRDAITPLVLLGLALALGSALLGFVIARRLARPFQELAGHSRELGHGRFDIDVPSYAVPEAEAIGASLRGAATRLDGLVRREREFAVNASHHLRTPITALRLNLEDLALWPETTPEVRAELQHGLEELDRLTGAIDQILDVARGRRLEEEQVVELADLLTSTGLRWSRPLSEEGRELVLDASAPAGTRVPSGPVGQLLDALVDDLRRHGRGAITLGTRDAGTHLEIAVADEGPRDGAADELGVANELVELCGGHLSVDPTGPATRFVLWLPRRDDEIS